jgi:hypothetical protein
MDPGHELGARREVRAEQWSRKGFSLLVIANELSCEVFHSEQDVADLDDLMVTGLIVERTLTGGSGVPGQQPAAANLKG